MAHRYDDLALHDLRARPLAKWRNYDDDVLPLWVADMDFPVAEPVRAALRDFADGDAYGYPAGPALPGVVETVCQRMWDRHGWQVEPDQVMPLNGIVTGLAGAVRAFASRGDGVLATTPIYPPFQSVTERYGRRFQTADLAQGADRFELDTDTLDAAIDPSTRLLMLCHPHNPTGRVFDDGELDALAERVVAHRLFVVSDELHADLNFGPRHRPFATVDPEVGRRTVTLVGPTKAFNLAGLKVGFAVAQDKGVLERFQAEAGGPGGFVPSPSQLAAKAAWTDGDPWLADTLAYLRSNRDRLERSLQHDLPEVGFHPGEATYLAWLDFTRTPFAEDPYEALLQRARVALNPGISFGEAGRSFARLNFATSWPLVEQALARIRTALRAG